MKFIKSLLAAASAAAAIAVPMSALATPTIQILYDNVQVLFCADESSCDLFSGEAGVVQVNGTFGVFRVTTETGTTQPAVSFPDLMDLAVTGNVNNNTGAVHTLEIRFSETQFTSGGIVTGTYSNNNTNLSGKATAWFGDANTLFDTTNLIGSSTQSAASIGSFTGDIFSAPYSLTTSLFFTAGIGATGALSNDFRLTIPEPGTVALVALALLGAGFSSRRRA